MNFTTRWLPACCLFSVGLMAPEIDEPTKKEYFIYTEGADKGQASLGIYRIQNGSLMICYARMARHAWRQLGRDSQGAHGSKVTPS